MSAKLIGAVLGYLFTRSLLGALAGFLFGMWIDNQRQTGGGGFFSGADADSIRQTFLDASFAVMGHVCKADGHVSEAEIATAQAFMDRLNLDADARQRAIQAFQRGKSPEFDLRDEIMRFRRACHSQPQLVRMFIEVQLEAALADGRIDPAEEVALRHVASHLGLSRRDFERLEAFLRAAHQGRRPGGVSREQELANAYQVLGVEADASTAVIKKAYRRLMSQHHPDKLASKGLPEEMRKLAEEKTREIGAAYEVIKKERGFV